MEPISNTAHFEWLLSFCKLVCFHKEVIFAPLSFPSAPMCLLRCKHISLSAVGVKAQEVLCSNFTPVTEAIYSFQGPLFLPALNTHQRMIRRKTAWNIVGFLFFPIVVRVTQRSEK